MKLKLRYMGFVYWVLFLFVLNANAEAKEWDSGLIIENYKRVRISIKDISDDGKKIYLTKDAVRSKVVSQLQKNGLVPTNDPTIEGVLSIQLNVFQDTCAINISFNRLVYYSSRHKTYVTFGKVWHKNAILIHSGDASYILNSLETHMDDFISAYKRENEKIPPYSE